jgi:hypothetical protein
VLADFWTHLVTLVADWAGLFALCVFRFRQKIG